MLSLQLAQIGQSVFVELPILNRPLHPASWLAVVSAIAKLAIVGQFLNVLKRSYDPQS